MIYKITIKDKYLNDHGTDFRIDDTLVDDFLASFIDGMIPNNVYEIDIKPIEGEEND